MAHKPSNPQSSLPSKSMVHFQHPMSSPRSPKSPSLAAFMPMSRFTEEWSSFALSSRHQSSQDGETNTISTIMPIPPVTVQPNPRKHGKLVRPASRRLRYDVQAMQPLSLARSITFSAATYPAESFTEDYRLRTLPREDPAVALLRGSCGQRYSCDMLLQTSLLKSDPSIRDIIPQRHGFVLAVLEAYNNHRALTIRPDDVWLAILLQFNAFARGNAELLRSSFVNHDGQKYMNTSNLYAIDAEEMMRQIPGLVEDTVADHNLREWCLPTFSTTTINDTMTCNMVMLAHAGLCFSHDFHLSCEIPRITLEGEKRDWEVILARLEKLKEYGIKTIAWHHLLRPIISRFITAYDDPNSSLNLEFWSKIVYFESCGLASSFTGWITAFCVFDERGNWQGNPLNEGRGRHDEHRKLLRPVNPLSLTPVQFCAVYTFPDRDRYPYLILDGFPYPKINSERIPAGHGYVDITLHDNGAMLDAVIAAGLIGSQIYSPEKSELFPNGARDTIRPVTGWWLFVAKEEEEEGRPRFLVASSFLPPDYSTL